MRDLDEVLAAYGVSPPTLAPSASAAEAGLPTRDRAQRMLERHLAALDGIAGDASASPGDRIAAVREIAKIADAYREKDVQALRVEVVTLAPTDAQNGQPKVA